MIPFLFRLEFLNEYVCEEEMEMVEPLVSGRVAEEILKSIIDKPLHFNDNERIRLAKNGKRNG